MTKHLAGQHQRQSSSPPGATPPNPGAPDAGGWQLLALATLLPLAVTLALFRLNVPLGRPGKFVYLYSPIAVQRLTALPAALLLAALLGVGAWLAFSPLRARRAAGFLLLVTGGIGLAGWAYFAPPQFRSQHFFNMQSPSHDGAFLAEAFHVRRVGLRSYLRDFPQRAQRPSEQMRGTRVISNPPATTLLAVGTIGLLERSPRLARWVYTVSVREDLPPEADRLVTVSMAFSLALLWLWLLAALPLYWSGRQFFSPPAAAVLTVVCFVSPPTLLFTPGKDPAQLLTVALPLWLWLLAWRRERAWAAAASGGVFVLACLVSLVHIWIAAIVVTATALHIPAEDWRRFALRLGLPALCGALVVVAGLGLFADVNFFAYALSAARAQGEITRGEGAMPFTWQTLGVPLFLLFAGPALWCVGLWLWRRRLHDRDARFGLHLVLGAAAVMLATIGFTNLETPRLWIPFLPLLLLGAGLQLPAFRYPQRKGAILLAALVFVQVAASAAQWSLMDVRETETRLLHRDDAAPRFFE